jgi:hypothetical protein
MKINPLVHLSLVLLAAFSVGCSPPSPIATASSASNKAAPIEVASAAATTSKPVMPEAIKVDETKEQMSAEIIGKGVQIYTCSPKKDNPKEFAWAFKAPEAKLTDTKGNKIGKHFAGPTWEGNDGSKVVGMKKEEVASPDANAVPWLLLDVKSSEGKGVFGKITHIQRINTSGGKAPATGCDSQNVNKETRVNYQATYYFWTAKY